MPPIPTEQSGAVPSVEEEFLALLCSDEELLRAEFEEIIAAEWPSPPPDATGATDRAGDPPRRTRHRGTAGLARLRTRPRHPGIGGWARERSPPPGRQPTAKAGKAGDVTA
jgi:hypothetical protein